MGKRILAWVLCIGLLFALTAHTSAAEDGLSFIAVDDTLPAELVNVTANIAGAIYVPYWLFTSYSFGLNYSFFTASTTAYLHNAERQLFFNLSTGATFDDDDYQYSVSAVYVNGTVYLPLRFVCSYFGTFSYASVGSNEYGSVLRLDLGSSALTDEEFMRAAKPVMARYYNAWNTEAEPEVSAAPTIPEEPAHTGDSLCLGLCGFPRTETLELLQRLNLSACFFLTEAEICAEPDMVRRLSCEGYPIGIAFPEGAQGYSAAAERLFEVCRVRSVMVLQEPDAEPIAGTAGFCLTADDPAAGLALLDTAEGERNLILPASAERDTELHEMLYALRDQGFAVQALREIHAEN